MSNDLISSRIFSTDVGVRPAEPCSVSVAAQHQVLTQLFLDISYTILNNENFRRMSGAVVTETDLQTLEKCNVDNIESLELIVGADSSGNRLPQSELKTEQALRDAGKLWSDHILENARALILTFLYIIGTVTVGYPLVTGLAVGAGLDDGNLLYISK